MNIKEIKNEFKSFLKDDLKKTIYEIEIAINCESKHYDNIIMFYSQISKLNRDHHIQVISYEEYTLGINRIKNGVIEIINELKEEDLSGNMNKEEKTNPDLKNENKQDDSSFEKVGYGEFKDKNEKFKLTIAPTVFFSYRFAKAFPGIRGLKWFEGDAALKRLSLLLHEPTRFDIADGYGLHTDPIWWFRGSSGLSVEQFKIHSHGKCLLNFDELKVSRIAAYNSRFYYKCFVYVETMAESPVGIYDYPEGFISDTVKSLGYFYEEYGLYEGIPIRREEFDDGAAEINGEVINTSGAELRIRYLTKYNFILVAKTSPFNSREGNKLGDEFMNDILHGKKRVEEFAEMADMLDKNRLDE
jgi:hypothetical protein